MTAQMGERQFEDQAKWMRHALGSLRRMSRRHSWWNGLKAARLSF
jgi:hypothetical protein